jgi:hypothetical protein
MNFFLFAILLNVLALPATQFLTADLKPETLAGFERYVNATEIRIAKEESEQSEFLYFDLLPAPQRNQIIESLRQGRIFIRRLTTRDPSGRPIEAPGGLLHHWLGIVFIAGASVQQVLGVVEDYNRQSEYYHPQVVRARLISRRGNAFRVYLRLQEKKMITVTLDTEHEVHYAELDPLHWSSRSYSTRIQQVENAGQRSESLLPVGHDGGFLWRINSYWRFEESDGGVYVQCESISLTRDIPTGFGWLVEPFVTGIPRESIGETLSETRSAVLAR